MPGNKFPEFILSQMKNIEKKTKFLPEIHLKHGTDKYMHRNRY